MARSVILIILFQFSTVHAAISSGKWLTLSTDHFDIHYLPSYSQQAERSAHIAETLYPQLHARLSWQPKERISIVIIDEHDKANGSATPYPFNKVILRLSPPDKVTQLDDYDDWLALLIEHELTHIFHLDKASGNVSSLRKAFGRHVLLFPNLFQPAWFIEGLATYVETHKGIGRGQSSSFEMLMREEVNKGILAVDTVNLPADSLPISKHYLYGVYFYQYLKDTYGEESISRLVRNYSDNLLPFAINTNAKRVLGKDIEQLWSGFNEYLNLRFLKQISKLKKSKIKEGVALNQHLSQLSSIEFTHDSSIISINNTLESQPQLTLFKGSTEKKLTTVNNNSYFRVGSGNKIYISQSDNCTNQQLFYDLYQYDLLNDELKQLTHCSRYKHFAVSANNNLVAVKTISAIPQLDLLDDNAKYIKTLWKGVYGDVISDIDWSEKRNKILITKKKLNDSWNIYEFDLTTKEWTDIVVGEALYTQARYALNDKSIVFSSDKSGVYNIYRRSLDNDKTIPISNVLSGAMSPRIHNNLLYYLLYERDGYRVHTTNTDETKVLLIKKIEQSEPRNYTLDAEKKYTIKEYSPWKDLKPKYWSPWLTVQDNASELGFVTSSNDSLDHHYYQLNLAYGYDQNESVGSFIYQYEDWLSLLISKENSIYSNAITDLTEIIRSNHQSQILLTLPYNKLNYRWQFNLGVISNKESDSFVASNITGFSDANDALLGFCVNYDSKKSFLKSHSPETGRDALLVTDSSDVFESDYAGQSTTLDWREYFSLGSHHVLALRYVLGSADSSMRNYSVGGLKNDWDDVTLFNMIATRKVFNKRDFSLRGYNENTQTGNNLELATVEWRFPLQQVERGIMAPPVGVMKHSARIFAEAGAAWTDNQEKTSLHSFGLEWIIDLNIFYNFTPQLRLGYAEGTDELGEQQYYVKIGGSF